MSAAGTDDVLLSRRVTWLCRLLGVGILALIGVTWKLWTPQDVFPRVPLFAWPPPRWWDWVSLAALVGGAVGLCLASPRWRRPAATAIALGFSLQFLADQHRLQPWAWQFFILAVVIALGDDRVIFRGWFLLTCTIYLWSARSKVDAAFLTQFGAIIQRMFDAVGNGPVNRSTLSLFANRLALVAPAVEAMVPILAIFIRTRRWAFLLSAAMHLYLILLLGPWGLGHQPGVLAWNLFFIAQNWLLFGDGYMSFAKFSLICDRPLSGAWPRVRRGTLEAALTFVLLWPAVEPWGYCDAWLGWAVYVPRFHRAIISVDQHDVTDADIPLSQFLESPPWVSDREVDIAQMSLALLAVPSYPNHRLAIGAALDFIERRQINTTVWIEERKNRFQTGWQREGDVLGARADIEAYARTFRVNALPESVLRRRAAQQKR